MTWGLRAEILAYQPFAQRAGVHEIGFDEGGLSNG